MSNIYELAYMKCLGLDDWECSKCNVKFLSNSGLVSLLIINCGQVNKKAYEGKNFDDCVKRWKLRTFE